MKTTAMRWALALVLLALTGTAWVFRDRFDAAALQAWVEGAGPAGPVVFIVFYAAATVLFLPGAVITLAGGALFGPVWGTVWNLAGATIGAVLAFLIARYLGAERVARRAGPRLQSLNDGVSAEGWRFVAFARLFPLFPFNLLNYALGLTRIPLAHYALASIVFMLPGAIAYTWLGYAGREALSGGDGLVRNLLIALALVSALAILPRLVRRLRKPAMLPAETLKQHLDEGGDVLVLDVRPAADFGGDLGHVPGAQNVPLEDVRARLSELEPSKRRPVRLVCRTDRRSSEAAVILAEAGFTDARVIRGGMTAWWANDWPVQRS